MPKAAKKRKLTSKKKTVSAKKPSSKKIANPPLPQTPNSSNEPEKTGFKQTLSVIIVILVGLATVLTVLLVNERRSSLELVTRIEDLKSTPVPEDSKTPSTQIPSAKAFSKVVELPEPDLETNYSVEEALSSRRSQRVFEDEALSLEEVSQMLWAGNGTTTVEGKRTAPSARELYPYTLYLVARNIKDLDPGMYQYIPETHSLGDLSMPDAGDRLIDAKVQEAAQTSPAVIILSASVGKMVERFPDNPIEVTYLEGGHIGQNLYLQAESLGLGMVTMAGFDPLMVAKTLDLHQAETVVYLVPLGYPAPEEEAEEVVVDTLEVNQPEE